METNDSAESAVKQNPWQALGLTPKTVEQLGKAGFTVPTPVQKEGIPLALEGRDVIASAQTGTGKTLCFVLPMIEKFEGREGTFGVILCPTREIAQQTQQVVEDLGASRKIRSVVLVGGVDMRYDAKALEGYPQIIVATPGRLCDHLERGNIWLDYIEMVVLDEADRMLDMGFAAQLSRIMQDMPKQRQTLLFSATFNPPVEKLASKILYEPARVKIGQVSAAAVTIEQRVIFMNEEDKPRKLRALFKEEPGSLIVFTRSKDAASKLYFSLHGAGVYDATFIHSDRLQVNREKALADFKSGACRILIATDVAARGLDVENVAHVVNYEMPLEAEDYIHRIGRTGRAGQTGKATSFCSPREKRLLAAVERKLGKRIPSEFGGEALPLSADDSQEPRRNDAGHSRSSRPHGGGGGGRSSGGNGGGGGGGGGNSPSGSRRRRRPRGGAGKRPPGGPPKERT